MRKHFTIPFFVTAIAALTFMAGCKKETADTRTGLEALTDPKSTSFCVFIVGKDTVVWENLAQDSVIITSGKIKGFFGMWDYLNDEYRTGNANCAYSAMFVRFVQPTKYMYEVTDCDFPNTLIKPGRVHMINGGGDDSTGVCLGLKNKAGTDASSARNTETNFEVLSVTDIPTENGCKKVRVKAKFDIINFYNSICGPVPQFTAREGVMQMDFQIN